MLCLISLCWEGCVESIYHEGPRAPASALSPRHQWRIFGDLQEPHKALDGEISSAALSDNVYDGASITIDLGRPCLFNAVAIEHGAKEFGFCRTVALLTSLDGQAYKHRHALPGTRRVTIITTVTPILARYVRLQAEVGGLEAWSVAEVHIQ